MCIYMHISLSLYLYIYIYVYTHVCMYVCIYIYIYMNHCVFAASNYSKHAPRGGCGPCLLFEAKNKDMCVYCLLVIICYFLFVCLSICLC